MTRLYSVARRAAIRHHLQLGDHLAAGWQFGPRRDHELTLRIQHFSNAGIRHPNPGENFVQLRYARRF